MTIHIQLDTKNTDIHVATHLRDCETSFPGLRADTDERSSPLSLSTLVRGTLSVSSFSCLRALLSCLYFPDQFPLLLSVCLHPPPNISSSVDTSLSSFRLVLKLTVAPKTHHIRRSSVSLFGCRFLSSYLSRQALCSTSLSPADVISLASCLPVDVLPDLHPVLQLHVVNTCSSSPSSSPSFPPLLSLGEGAGLEREDPFPGRRACASLLRSLEQAIQNQHRASLYSEPTPNSDHLITSSLFQQPSPHTASSSSFFFPLSSSSSPPASIAVLPALLTVTNAALEHLRKVRTSCPKQRQQPRELLSLLLPPPTLVLSSSVLLIFLFLGPLFPFLSFFRLPLARLFCFDSVAPKFRTPAE